MGEVSDFIDLCKFVSTFSANGGDDGFGRFDVVDDAGGQSEGYAHIVENTRNIPRREQRAR